MTICRSAPSELASSRARGGRRKSRKCLILGAVAIAAALIALPGPASANCDVTDTGIPDDAAFKADIGGTRPALERAGLGVGG